MQGSAQTQDKLKDDKPSLESLQSKFERQEGSRQMGKQKEPIEQSRLE